MSGIIWKKSKFFINRVVIYFGFLFIPLYLEHLELELSPLSQSTLILLYLSFIFGQWFLMGKEIDHRFKIYFRANSSLDRILYRIIVGAGFNIFIFSWMSYLPSEWQGVFFWGFWIFLGLFYSWPTRGKIIEESVSNQLNEYRYLDGFEKSVLTLILLLTFLSFPVFPLFENLDSLKLFIDPDEKISQFFWGYLSFNYYPFKNMTQLTYLAWCIHFYFVGITIYLLSSYCVFRFYFSRRLSVLGTFAVISSWSFSLALMRDPFHMMLAIFAPLWIWAIIWAARSGTYRSGLMLGFVLYILVLLNYKMIIVYPVSLLMLIILLRESNRWYKKQFFKYTLVGFILCLTLLFAQIEFHWLEDSWRWSGFFSHLQALFKRKAFFILSIFGLFTLIPIFRTHITTHLSAFLMDKKAILELLLLIFISMLIGIYLEQNFLKGFGLLWILSFFSLLPLEWIFQVISRLRSRRNIIYLVYILVCLLDSHIEGRFRRAGNFFKEVSRVSSSNQ